MKILVPTDFSALSKVAVLYAANMAKKLYGAEIILLHIVYIDASARTQVAMKEKQLLDAMADNATQEFVLLTNEIKKLDGSEVKITPKIVKGCPVEDVIENFAYHNNIDLIIMGTKGASGIKKVLMGSNAAAVISNSTIPVITVPEHSRFKPIKNIIYATDLQSIENEIKALIPLAQLFESTVHILHVISPDSKKIIDKAQIKKDIVSKYTYPHIFVQVSISDDITEGIGEYIVQTKADMIAMFTHKLTFFEKLFGKSFTRKVAFHTWIPLLAIKKAF
ncbi:MAG: universal stress protein [Candidatus Scalindua sp.]|nr:universal stress protein [Candidatus Scalindua sp.]